jgi:hypothetical protein
MWRRTSKRGAGAGICGGGNDIEDDDDDDDEDDDDDDFVLDVTS